MPHRVYRFRVLGMALGGLPILVVLNELQASAYYWIWWAFVCYIWPHLAFFIAKNSKEPFIAERNNLIFDSFIAGSWAPLLHFNLLPSILLPAITLSDKVSSGIKKLWLYSIPFIIFGAALFTTFTGFAFQPNTSMSVILACLPILVIHTLVVSIGNSHLVRQVQFQNIKFSELSQKDSLTSLFNRRHWQEKAELLMQQCRQSNAPATMVFIDIDYFKQINDKHGHSVGDDVLLAIAEIIQKEIPKNAVAGRFGGDEFAIALPIPQSQAKTIAKKICNQVKSFEPNDSPNLKCTLSIGISETNHNKQSLRDWIDAADKSLYQAKNMGRNQVV